MNKEELGGFLRYAKTIGVKDEWLKVDAEKSVRDLISLIWNAYLAGSYDLRAELTTLRAELKAERECVDWYAGDESWWNIGGNSYESIASDDCDERVDIGEGEVFTVGGKRARARQKEREI